ncbi:hypothetical protein F5Y14DRAFT_446832 [Nemania sp. NC0429]|nr:hypothetical protein F5Y14DRAFT_446832 [Nemania sp. NC0429]
MSPVFSPLVAFSSFVRIALRPSVDLSASSLFVARASHPIDITQPRHRTSFHWTPSEPPAHNTKSIGQCLRRLLKVAHSSSSGRTDDAELQLTEHRAGSTAMY